MLLILPERRTIQQHIYLLKSDLMEPITPNKLLFGRNLLYRNTDHFDAKTDEISLTKRCKRTIILLTHFWNKS